jgi:PKD repeat protein
MDPEMEQKHMMHRLTTPAVLAAAVIAGACAITDTQPPPFAGPSEMALSLQLTANPDVLSLDGASQSQVRIVARDSSGQPKSGVLLRAETVVDGVAVDYGSLSARTRTTDGSGTATFTYTAPEMVGNDVPNVQVSITPEGAGYEDAASHIRRLITIRLVPPGVIGALPNADFTSSPPNPAAFTDVRFDASASSGGLGAAITSYVWDFGDNSSGTGVAPTHQYSLPGAYQVKLTVTNSSGLSHSVTKAITIGAGAAPTANFVFSPNSPSVGVSIFFNGSSSTAGLGHRIVQYDWDFGNNVRRSGVSVSNSYSAAGVYNVTLTVTDEVGQTAQIVRAVTVGASTAVASFTFSPGDPSAGTLITFNASSSRGENNNSIRRYQWNFGCSAPAQCTTATFTSTTSATVTNTFNVPFTFVVTLTITDSQNKTATTTQEVTVAP